MRRFDHADAKDEELVARLAGGDHLALTALYDRYGRLSYGLALRILRDPAGAEEVVQDVFLKLWRRPGAYVPERGQFAGWLMSVTHHRAIDELRRLRREPVGIVDETVERLEVATDHDDPAELAWMSEQRDEVRAAVAGLPSAQREAIELAFFGGFTHREIAQTRGEPLGTVKTRIRLGMEKLRRVLVERERTDTPGTNPQATPDGIQSRPALDEAGEPRLEREDGARA